MKIAVKVKLFKLYGYVLSNLKNVYNECSNDIQIQTLYTNLWQEIRKKQKPTIGAHLKTFKMVYYTTYNNLIECMCKSKNY